MQAQRNVCWRLNWYRQSELEGALLLGRMVRRVTDPYLISRLTRHCADEARHAWLWTRTLEVLGMPLVRIRRAYQSFYFDEISTPRTPLEVLALTHIFEQRVHKHFSDELSAADTPSGARTTFSVLLRDEQLHLDWIRDWLAAEPGAETILNVYRAADERVFRRLTPYRDRLWDVEGLGEELTDAGDVRCQAATVECHAPQPQHSAPTAP